MACRDFAGNLLHGFRSRSANTLERRQVGQPHHQSLPNAIFKGEQVTAPHPTPRVWLPVCLHPRTRRMLTRVPSG
jgi:hypothetical protein